MANKIINLISLPLAKGRLRSLLEKADADAAGFDIAYTNLGLLHTNRSTL